MITINDCEREIVISPTLIISFDEHDRMLEALMKIKHPNLIIDKPENKWVQSFIKSETNKHILRILMRCFLNSKGIVNGIKKRIS